MTPIELKSGERIEDLGRNGYRIIQNPKLFCFGMDAVLLSAFVRMSSGEKALDLGTGSGIIPILLRARTDGRNFTGLEIQDDSADMAERSVCLNGLQDEIAIVKGDIKEAAALFKAASFDVVTCNPPYMPADHGINNPEDSKAVARHELLCTFHDVAAASSKLLKPGGRLYLVHRPFRLAEIFCELCESGIEPKRVRFVHPYISREPNMVLIEAHRGAKKNLKVESPLVVFEKPGIYTEEIQHIYND